MSIRYLSSSALAVVAGFLIVAFKAFSPGVYEWLAFGGGIAIVTIALAAGAVDRGRPQRALNALAAVAGGWSIVSSELREERALHAVGMRANQTSPSGRAAGLAS